MLLLFSENDFWEDSTNIPIQSVGLLSFNQIVQTILYFIFLQTKKIFFYWDWSKHKWKTKRVEIALRNRYSDQKGKVLNKHQWELIIITKEASLKCADVPRRVGWIKRSNLKEVTFEIRESLHKIGLSINVEIRLGCSAAVCGNIFAILAGDIHFSHENHPLTHTGG